MSQDFMQRFPGVAQQLQQPQQQPPLAPQGFGQNFNTFTQTNSQELLRLGAALMEARERGMGIGQGLGAGLDAIGQVKTERAKQNEQAQLAAMRQQQIQNAILERQRADLIRKQIESEAKAQGVPQGLAQIDPSLLMQKYQQLSPYEAGQLALGRMGIEQKYASAGQEMLRENVKVSGALADLSEKNARIESIGQSLIQRSKENTGSIWNSSMAMIPGTSEHDFRTDLDTILANAGFDELQKMRDNSPTGGALGQVTERELDLLQSSAVALRQSQSPEKFSQNMKIFLQQRESSFRRVKDAYRATYGAEYQGGALSNSPQSNESSPQSVILFDQYGRRK